MQFTANGPDIPDSLVQAHEEGRVVFFCGAGISYPAGLPSFRGLVDETYRRLDTTQFPIERDVYESGRYDATLDLLEQRFPGGRIVVRRALAQALQPKLRRRGATNTHAALLQLACSREATLRLVTTNFDRVFEHVIRRSKRVAGSYAAPMLPVPKNSRWNGVVYLHGLLPAKPDDSALNRLVLTSGDFGLAYLTERWAARFVSDLFRSYVICFVGYSINDLVLRYMMDALAADRRLGEFTPNAYALGECATGQQERKTIEWKAKGVIPILYEVPQGTHDHSALHNTLKAWADTYRDGILGRERIVVDYALARPSDSSRQDDFVGRMLWALSHESGLPAKRFADFSPAPALEWLEAFSEERFGHADLIRFGISPKISVDEKLRFSLIRRPAPYILTPWMTLVSGPATDTQWDEVMSHLGRWLVRHLNAPDLIIWLADRGGLLNGRWRSQIEYELDRIWKLQQDGNSAELERIRADAPDAIPGLQMRKLWGLLLGGSVKTGWANLDFYRWKDRLVRDGLTTTSRRDLRELLAPKVALKRPFMWGLEGKGTGEITRIKELIDWDLMLAGDGIQAAVRELNDEVWLKALPMLLKDFQELLIDALDLLRELDGTVGNSDGSYWDLPSISPHWQNRGFRDWVTLIELLRDAWLSMRNVDPEGAAKIAKAWFDVKYPTFKRLALFAASQDFCIDPETWVDWLLTDDAWWLWSTDTHRETMRLIVLQGSRLGPAAQLRLENAILAGPPRYKFGEDLEPEAWQEFVDHVVWVHLAKLRVSGLILGSNAQDRFSTLSALNPGWQLEPHERDEFPHWMSGTGDPDFDESRVIDIAPTNREELVKWLKQPPPVGHPFREDTWKQACRTQFPDCLFALRELAKEKLWPAHRWREALQAWSDEAMGQKSLRLAGPLIQAMPDETLVEIVHALTWWLEVISKFPVRHEASVLNLCSRILDLSFETDSSITRNGKPIDQPVTEAINHPIGHVTQALINLWFKRTPNDDDGLPSDIEPYFTQICNRHELRFRHGRTLLASQLIALFRVDRPWTVKNLLPALDWSVNPSEARSAWEGFLWSPRLFWPLLIVIKSQFLQTARHCSELGEHGRQFAAFLTYVALEHSEGYTAEDFRIAFEFLPKEKLQDAARALFQALEGAGDQRENYWRNRVRPFWRHVWPKSGDLVTEGIGEALIRLAIAARAEFPEALSTVQDWLRPMERPFYVVRLLSASGLCSRFPADALRLLNAVIVDQRWEPPDLARCLEEIVNASPALRQDSRYQMLETYLLRHGRRSR